MRGLRRQNVGDVRALHVLVVQGTGIEHRVFPRGRGTVDVDGKLGAVAYRHLDIALLNEPDRIVHRFLPAVLPKRHAMASRLPDFTIVKYSKARQIATLNLTVVKLSAISGSRRARAWTRAGASMGGTHGSARDRRKFGSWLGNLDECVCHGGAIRPPRAGAP